MKKSIILIIVIILFSSVAFSVQTQDASLFLSPLSGTFEIGDTFSVELKVDTGGFPINAAQGTIYFPNDKLEVLNISKENSIFALWPEEATFSNLTGKISFSGGIPHPGFTGVGNIITINFKAKNEGETALSLGEGKVLADDGKGTDILVFIKEAKYFLQKETILPEIKPEVPPNEVPLPPQILSSTHPKEDEWYNNNSPHFQWGIAPDIIGASFLLDRDSGTIPDEISEGRFDSKIYANIEDGIWYFHLRLENAKGWSQTSHRKIQVDNRPPTSFEIVIDNARDLTNPNPDLYFETGDDTSGINYYKLKIGSGDFLKLMQAEVNPFSLPFQSPGNYLITVRAVDKAGNAAEAKTTLDIEPIKSPQITLKTEKYLAGEETFYLEGTALPDVEVLIFLEKNGREIKKWSTQSNHQGDWTFSTKELIKSGIYDLSALAKDARGAESEPSAIYKIEASLSGVSLGPFLITFKTLAYFLILFLLVLIFAGCYFNFKIRLAKKILQKETREAKESLQKAFSTLDKEIEQRIRMFDSQPEFSAEERKVYEDLKKALKTAEESVRKEIEDVERESR